MEVQGRALGEEVPSNSQLSRRELQLLPVGTSGNAEGVGAAWALVHAPATHQRPLHFCAGREADSQLLPFPCLPQLPGDLRDSQNQFTEKSPPVFTLATP